MSSLRKPVLAALLLPLLAGTAFQAGTAEAADLSVRPYMRAEAEAQNAPAAMASSPAKPAGNDVGAVAMAPANAAAPNAAISSARTARAKFSEARASMERAMLLRDTSPATVTMVEAAATSLLEEMKAIERAAGQSDAVRKAIALVQDWYRAGLTIIKPPASGVTELPMPTTVSRKADAAAAALDQLVEEATARAATPQRATKRRPQPAPRPVASAPVSPSVLPFVR